MASPPLAAVRARPIPAGPLASRAVSRLSRLSPRALCALLSVSPPCAPPLISQPSSPPPSALPPLQLLPPPYSRSPRRRRLLPPFFSALSLRSRVLGPPIQK